MTAHEQLPIDHLSREQTLDTEKSFIVQAPAGSGKTELLIQRFLKLLAEVNEPEEILAITFTKAATAEMRERVLKALRKVAVGEGENPLADAALSNDSRRGWNLLQQPQRLNIQTIDAVCMSIAHQTPLLSRLGGSLRPTEKPQPLYTLAARRTLAGLGGDPELSAALRALLQMRGTSLPECQRLIADMLDKRDQWSRELPLGQNVNWRQVREILEKPLRREHELALEKAQLLFSSHPELSRELLEIVRDACRNLDPDSELLRLRRVTHIDQVTGYRQWKCLSDFLLTKDGKWRKSAPTQSGFLTGNPGKAARDRYRALLDRFREHPELLAMLSELHGLPPAQYNDDEWQTLLHMLVILRYAMAQLRVVFAEQGVVDFVELGLAARQVLCDDEGELSELAVDVSGSWRHILVDEFQDTSRSQYELLTLLAGGWESAGRGTCFLVGDPMQSIYMFRQAEVELFERTRRHGLGEGTAAIPLTPLQLQTNFRSHAGLVNPLNKIFETVFEQSSAGAGNDYQVTFAPSEAHDDQVRTGLHLWPFFRASKAGPEEKRATADEEARKVVSVIEGYEKRIASALKRGQEFRVAVLVRARPHLALIASRLRKSKILFRAVEIEQLGQRQEVKDLTALTRALLHPMDRIAWLTVLRAPWCGLLLKDLHTLCGNDDKDFASQPILTLLRDRLPLLSEDAQPRAKRVHAVLENALRARHRQSSLARWVERCWLTLGGAACVDAAARENVRAFFAMLEDLGPAATGLEERLAELCAQPDPAASERCGVQLMTIHQAKGLGFDVVIVPGLERVTRPETQPLLRWLEQTRLVGSSEQEEREFVVAPIGKNAEPGALYEWIGKQKARREDDEARRLLYVAATRAKQELHLLGTALIKVPRDGVQGLSRGDKRSLLGIAWKALEPSFMEAWAAQGPSGPSTPQQGELPFPASAGFSALRRLPANWAPPPHARAEESPGRGFEMFERPSGSLAARAFGTVVHALLEDLARLPEIGGDGVYAEVGGWRPRALALLRAAGLSRGEAEAQSAEVVKVLLGVLGDPVGRWILGARSEAQSEVSWSTLEGAGVRTLRGDRIFRAGAVPGSLENTHLWIVDYKTSKHGSTGLDAFLADEKARYRPQLEAYAEVMRKVRGQATLFRLGLYYPLLGRLEWW